MPIRRTTAAALLALSSLAGQARAQRSGSVELGLALAWQDLSDSLKGGYGFGGAGRVGVWLPARFSIELEVDYTRPNNYYTLTHEPTVTFTGAVLYNFRLGQVNSFFVRAGYSHIKMGGACDPDTDIWCAAGGAFLLGAGVRLRVASSLYVRGDLGANLRPDISGYRGFVGTVGLSFIPGGKRGTGGQPAATPRGQDADRDGVPDKADRCPNSPLGALVNQQGCPTDHDSDGVPDGLDRCPSTPLGTPVDPVGCTAAAKPPQ